MSEQNVRTEEFQISGDMLVAKIKELVQEGNIRRVAIKNEEGRTLIEFPLTLGVVGAVLAPQLAAIGAVAALVTRCVVAVEKVEE
jgi:DNA-binding HxlR family transcriptional regulator